MTIRPRRSVLYMPGSNARAIEKARTLAGRRRHPRPRGFGCARRPRPPPRQQVLSAVTAGGFGAREVHHSHQRPRHRHGGSTISTPRPRPKPDAVLVPKVSTSRPPGRRRPNAWSTSAPTTRSGIWAMMETPLAMLNAGEIAAAAKDVETQARGFRDGHQRSRQGDARANHARPRTDACRG